MMLSQTLGRLVPLDLLTRGPAGAGTQVSVMSSSLHSKMAASSTCAQTLGCQLGHSGEPRCSGLVKPKAPASDSPLAGKKALGILFAFLCNVLLHWKFIS